MLRKNTESFFHYVSKARGNNLQNTNPFLISLVFNYFETERKNSYFIHPTSNKANVQNVASGINVFTKTISFVATQIF